MTLPESSDHAPASTLALPVGPGLLGQALSWLDAVASAGAWDAHSRHVLLLILDEVLSNALRHAFPAQAADAPPPAVELACRYDDRQIRLDIADNGIAFDPTAAELPDLPTDVATARIGGHGIRLMRHYLDRIDYRRDHDWNRLALTLARRAPDASQAVGSGRQRKAAP